MRHVYLPLILAGLAACTASGPAAPAPGGDQGPPPPADPPPTASDAQRSLEVAPLASPCGTPTVDGALSPGEWDDAVTVRFAATLPASQGGGVVPAEVRALSDDRNLYLSFRLGARTDALAQSHAVELDADASGDVSAGDDALVFSWQPTPWGDPAGLALFADDYRWACTVGGQPVLCGTLDGDAEPAGIPVGTTDGDAAFGFEAAATVVELWHPYGGADLRDVRRRPGELLPMAFFIRLLDPCNEWPRCYGDTTFPVTGYREVRLGCGAPPADEALVEVRIDVKPGDVLPTIRLGAAGTTPVAVISGALDAAGIDPASLWFAGAPVARQQDGAPRAALGDVDGDGRPDLVAHFATAALQLTPADTTATLAGRTRDGRAFRGSDVVRVIP